VTLVVRGLHARQGLCGDLLDGAPVDALDD
jgi:hypothetical protein